jgi:hypothetical protein
MHFHPVFYKYQKLQCHHFLLSLSVSYILFMCSNLSAESCVQYTLPVLWDMGTRFAFCCFSLLVFLGLWKFESRCTDIVFLFHHSQPSPVAYS